MRGHDVNRIEVIGLSGKVGSGKDYLGLNVLRRAGYHQWAYAWPLKMQALGQGATYEEVFVTKPPAVREMLQIVGTEQGRDKYGQNYWLKIADGWLRTLHENLGISKFYFTDVRFPNEVDFIHNLGGKVVRLLHGDRIYPLQDSPAALHSSETVLDDYQNFDAVFVNGLDKTPYHFRIFLESAGILPRWDDSLETGASSDRMDDRFGALFNEVRGAPCFDVPPVPIAQAIEEARNGQG